MGLTDSYAYFLPVHALYQIVSIKLCHNKHTFYSQLSNLDGFERGFRRDFSGKKVILCFSSLRGQRHGVLEGMHG